MNIRRFNSEGIRKMEEFLDLVRTTESNSIPRPEDLLTDSSLSEEVPPGIEVSLRDFSSRFEAAGYLNQALNGTVVPGLAKDTGLWAWLSLFYFEQLAPQQTSGKRKVGEQARWIPAVGNFRRYYRHLLAGPYSIYKSHSDAPERAYVLLANPAHSPGEPAEQIAAYQEIVTNTSLLQASTSLYVDEFTKQYKRGASSKGAGTPRRFAEVLGQFDLTWDLYSMSADSILEMLPAEFDQFK